MKLREEYIQGVLCVIQFKKMYFYYLLSETLFLGNIYQDSSTKCVLSVWLLSHGSTV